jgi:hypothetical protein
MQQAAEGLNGTKAAVRINLGDRRPRSEPPRA